MLQVYFFVRIPLDPLPVCGTWVGFLLSGANLTRLWLTLIENKCTTWLWTIAADKLANKAVQSFLLSRLDINVLEQLSIFSGKKSIYWLFNLLKFTLILKFFLIFQISFYNIVN